MILQELTLHNFGVFKGQQPLRFAPPDERAPITLIGGLNGAGKTTLLDALNLALFGPLANLSGRRGMAWDAYLAQSIHKGTDPSDGAAVHLAFRTHVSGHAHEFRVQRTWRVNGGRLREHLEVLQNGRLDIDLTERWQEQVEAFVPRGIAPLFFFDAEQIERFADLENSRDLLRTAVGALLGLDLVDRLTRDLEVLERRKAKETSESKVSSAIAFLEGQLEELRGQEAACASDHERSQVRTRELAVSLAKAEAQFQQDGGDLFERRQEIEGRRAALASELAAVETELRDRAAGPACFLVLGEDLSEFLVRARGDLESLQGAALLSLLENRDREVTRRFDSATKKGLAQALSAILKEDRERRRGRITDPVLGLGADELANVIGLLEGVLPQEATALRALESKRRRLKATLDDVDRTVAAIPKPEVLEAVLATVNRLKGEFDEARIAERAFTERLQEIRRSIAEKELQLSRKVEESTHIDLEKGTSARVVKYSSRVRRTLEAFRIEASRRHVRRIEGLVMESLSQLLRKERLVRSVQVDPETFSILLTGEAGGVLEPRQLSAGERQLLAIAMLWGLAKASGRPLPVIVDTPLGRLDRTHRAHLVSRYFPSASHQVVLLSTDDEIDQPAFEEISRYVGAPYELRFDDASASTSIRPGYFWN